MKDELITYLKTKDINDIASLWGYAKDYYAKQGIAMEAGGYSSAGDAIRILLPDTLWFGVTLEEIDDAIDFTKGL